MKPRTLAGVLWVGLAVALPMVAAVHLGPDDINGVDVNVLLHHPYPDEKGDPWGLPATTVNGTRVDWLAGYYGAYVFPTAIFDGIQIVESVPQAEGAGAYNETYEGYRRLVESRRAADPALALRLDVSGTSTLNVTVTVTPAQAFPDRGLLLRMVLFEDDVPFNGGNGIFHHRFVVREMRTVDAVDLSLGEPLKFDASFSTASAGEPGRAGVVAYVQQSRDDSATFSFREVLQSATWRQGQTGPTVQSSKAVLLEMYSATWCAACVYGDAAADNLANLFGVASTRSVGGPFEYLRPVSWGLVALAALAAVGAAWALGRRPGRREGST